jgi:hypothetical protein
MGTPCAKKIKNPGPARPALLPLEWDCLYGYLVTGVLASWSNDVTGPEIRLGTLSRPILDSMSAFYHTVPEKTIPKWHTVDNYLETNIM